MPRIWVSIGSNVEREKNVRGALRALQEQFGPLVVSRVYETDAVGFDGTPFYNLVAGFDSELPPEALVKIFRHIEHCHDRCRTSEKFSDRTLDVDLLTWGDRVKSGDGLVLPRDEIEKYGFVLGPLAEVAPDQRHPLTDRTFALMWADFDRASQPMREVEFEW